MKNEEERCKGPPQQALAFSHALWKELVHAVRQFNKQIISLIACQIWRKFNLGTIHVIAHSLFIYKKKLKVRNGDSL